MEYKITRYCHLPIGAFFKICREIGGDIYQKQECYMVEYPSNTKIRAVHGGTQVERVYL